MDASIKSAQAREKKYKSMEVDERKKRPREYSIERKNEAFVLHA